jgi:hypothetical protein
MWNPTSCSRNDKLCIEFSRFWKSNTIKHVHQRHGIRVHQFTDKNPWDLVHYLVQVSATWLIQIIDTSYIASLVMNLRISNDKRCNYMKTNAVRTFIIVTAITGSLIIPVLLPTCIDVILFIALAKFNCEVCHSYVADKRIPFADYQCDVTRDVSSLAFIHGKNYRNAC